MPKPWQSTVAVCALIGFLAWLLDGHPGVGC
jgi:hypothetical protein